MGRPRKEDRPEDTVVLLLHAAEEEFGAKGFRETRLGDIAEAVGIRRSSLLYHFGSKEKLHSAVVERSFKDLGDVITRTIAFDGSVEEQLGRVVSGMLDFARKRPGLVCVILRQLVDPRGTGREQIAMRFETLVDGLEHVVMDIVGERMPEGFPVRSAILQLISGYLVRVASGDLGARVWRNEEATLTLANSLFLGSR